MDRELTIGTLARAAGVNVETIRYYQRRGLLEEPPKPLGSHRRYSHAAVKPGGFVTRGRQLGFTLEEVTSLLTLEDGRSCRETRLLAEQKLAVIETRIRHLSRMRRLLRGLVAECAQGKRPRACPIITTLMSGAEPSAT